MPQDGQRPGDGQKATQNGSKILDNFVFWRKVDERIACRVGTEIEAKREDHLHETSASLLQLEDCAPEQISQNETDKVEILGEFQRESCGEAFRGLCDNGIGKSSRAQKQQQIGRAS